MRLIDADNILQRVKGSTASKEVKCLAEVLIVTAPTVDAVAVTRCKDCKHGEVYDRTDGKKGIYCHCPCSIFYYGNGSIFAPVRENLDFCSYGEPKEATC